MVNKYVQAVIIPVRIVCNAGLVYINTMHDINGCHMNVHDFSIDSMSILVSNRPVNKVPSSSQYMYVCKGYLQLDLISRIIDIFFCELQQL